MEWMFPLLIELLDQYSLLLKKLEKLVTYILHGFAVNLIFEFNHSNIPQ